MSLLKNCQLLGVVTPPARKPGLLDLCRRLDYDPDQPRDENGQWSEGGAGGSVNSGSGIRIRQGTHVKVISSDVSAEHTEAILSVLDRDEAEYLEKAPLTRIDLKDGKFEIDGDAFEGLYINKNGGSIKVAGNLDESSFGDPYKPGEIFGVSDTMPDAIQASRAVLLHELGHHICKGYRPVAEDALARGGKPISEYAKVDAGEYLAESYSAYRTMPDRLKAYDPVGYQMIRTIRAERGMSYDP